jgi:hypothetical protein
LYLHSPQLSSAHHDIWHGKERCLANETNGLGTCWTLLHASIVVLDKECAPDLLLLMHRHTCLGMPSHLPPWPSPPQPRPTAHKHQMAPPTATPNSAEAPNSSPYKHAWTIPGLVTQSMCALWTPPLHASSFRVRTHLTLCFINQTLVLPVPHMHTFAL